MEFQQGRLSGTFKVDTFMNLMTRGKSSKVKYIICKLKKKVAGSVIIL